jgi:transcriptional regulator with XRE-family HTH domain
MSKQTPQDIAQWAEQKTAPTDSPTYKRLTDSERALIVKLNDDGLTQTEIAQRLNRSQSTISDVLSAFVDTTQIAKRYLAASALRMAENIVEKGQPRDHNVALTGIGVLKGDEKAELKVVIGMGLPGLPGTFASEVSTVSVCKPALSGDVGSDNARNVN